tara:strand:- start:326 stop:697 length:372 start_codon:yes stop_codon:yes gene_type:complete
MRVNMVNVVKGFIVAKPELADNDFDLMWAIWAWECSKLKPACKLQSMSARDLMKKLRGGELSSPFNISRSRRKAQQHYPETRGRKYEQKQNGQHTVKKDVKRETDKANRLIAERFSKGSRKST